MGPLASMYALIKAQNDSARREAGFDGNADAQYLFNSRLSPVFQRMNTGSPAPDPRGEGPIFLDDEAPMRPHGGLLEQESVFAPRKGLPPRGFRDPGQAGPSPPVDKGILAQMYGVRP